MKSTINNILFHKICKKYYFSQTNLAQIVHKLCLKVAETVVVISNGLSFKEGNARFATEPFKPLSNK